VYLSSHSCKTPSSPQSKPRGKSSKSAERWENVGLIETSSEPSRIGNPSPANGPGEPESPLRELFVQHQDELLGTLYHLLGNADDARDAYQEAFLKCWSRQKNLEGIESLKAWIFRVAINTARDLRQSAYRRRRQSLDSLGTREPVTSGDHPGQRIEQADEASRARQAIAQLRAEEKEVFLLRENGDMTYEQIAQMLALPVGTVKTRMRSALSKLRETLIGSEGG
jgi:RNA polymerase sigma-70 factor (ECF subfamily)